MMTPFKLTEILIIKKGKPKDFPRNENLTEKLDAENVN